jgi:hypothetical protein
MRKYEKCLIMLRLEFSMNFNFRYLKKGKSSDKKFCKNKTKFTLKPYLKIMFILKHSVYYWESVQLQKE